MTVELARRQNHPENQHQRGLALPHLGRKASALAAAHLRRATFGAATDKLLAKFDFIVSPATAIPAFEVGPEVPGDVILDRGVNAGNFASRTISVSSRQFSALSAPGARTPGSYA